jgi:hypothetical protein
LEYRLLGALIYSVIKSTTTKNSKFTFRNNATGMGLLSLTTLCVQLASGQTFQNMDFEAAGNQTIPASAVWLTWNLAATGWQHAAGANTLFVYHDAPPASLTQAYSLVDSSSSEWKPLAGNFSLALSSGYYSQQGNSTWVNAEISQQGLVPTDAHSFRLLAEGSFTVYMNSTEIPMSNLGGNLYAGDISEFAGQVATLEIASASTQTQDPVIVDSLTFSTQTVPEPGTLTLVGLGCVTFLGSFRFRRRVV